MILGVDLFVLDWNENVLIWILRLLVASICGLAIGVERTARSKEAGMRTHTIVCLAAALMMMVSKYGFADMISGSAIAEGTRGADSARIAAQVVSGIGFLGAGIIFYKRDLLHGLTTAAGVWATAGIGLAIGGGMIIIGVIATIILIALQIILHKAGKFVKRKEACLLKIIVNVEDESNLSALNDLLKIVRLERFKASKDAQGASIAEIEAISYEPWSPVDLYKIAKDTPYIKSIEKLEEA